MTDVEENSQSEQTSNQINTSDSSRHQWISVAAYFKAEAIGFDPGKDLDNWLEAEIEYTNIQVQSFILCCKEDGCMSICGLQALAKSMGIANTAQITTQKELIRLIQKATQHRPCFQTTYQETCANYELECPWRKECQQLIAIWYR